VEGERGTVLSKRGDFVVKKSFYALAFLVALGIFTTTACANVQGEVAECIELPCDIFFVAQEWGTLYQYQRDGLAGYKDADGNIVVEPQYKYAHRFSEGLAFVRGVDGREDQTGFIDLEGNLVIPLPIALRVGHFSEGLAHVAVRAWRMDEDPNTTSHYISGPLIFIDREGRDVFGEEFEDARPFISGLAVIRRYRGNEEFIDRTGQNPFGMEFRSAGRFDEDGFASVHMLDGTRTHIDRHGNIANRWDTLTRAISDEWGRLHPFGSDTSLFGFQNDHREIVIERQFRHANFFSEGLAFVQGVEGREYQTGFIDYTGELVIPLPNAISAGRFLRALLLSSTGDGISKMKKL